jgi:hypothetical protein
MKFQDQGTFIDCVYCKYIHPELLGSGNCPECHGRTPEFRPARMMDKPTSEREIFDRITTIFCHKADLDFKKELLTLLTYVDVYGFDFKNALVTLIRDIEMDKM